MKRFKLPLAVGVLVLITVLDAVADIPMGMMGEVGSKYDIPVQMSSSDQTCAGFVLASNTLIQTDHGREEGYASVGTLTLMMHPDNPVYGWVKQHRDQNVEIILRVQRPRKLERIQK